ncbi:hypothetical protein Drorol1_Dr00026431 [Drosera rotundifolia]
MSLVMKLVGIVVVVMVAAAPIAEATISCGQVVSTLSPCIGYVKGTEPEVRAPCCIAVKKLNGNSTPDRRAECTCLKQFYGEHREFDIKKAAAIPHICNVNVGYEISLGVDCSTIH